MKRPAPSPPSLAAAGQVDLWRNSDGWPLAPVILLDKTEFDLAKPKPKPKPKPKLVPTPLTCDTPTGTKTVARR